jgi:hypothetical protein
MMAGKRGILGCILGLATVFFSWPGAPPAQASCGAVTCFVVIGSQQQVSPGESARHGYGSNSLFMDENAI